MLTSYELQWQARSIPCKACVSLPPALREFIRFCQGLGKSHWAKSHMNWIIFARCDKWAAWKLSKGMFISVRRTFHDRSASYYKVAKVRHDRLPIGLLASVQTITSNLWACSESCPNCVTAREVQKDGQVKDSSLFFGTYLSLQTFTFLLHLFSSASSNIHKLGIVLFH